MTAINAVCTGCHAHIENATQDEAREFMRDHLDCEVFDPRAAEREAARAN